jgi:hypothetical protein
MRRDADSPRCPQVMAGNQKRSGSQPCLWAWRPGQTDTATLTFVVAHSSSIAHKGVSRFALNGFGKLDR